MRLWGIYYTSWDGSRQQYMSAGFESPESAQMELDRILRGQKKWHSMNDISHYDQTRCPAYIIGEDWEIEEIKLRKAL